MGLTILGVLLAAAGCGMFVVGALGWRRRLPRNRFAGVRTPATLRDDETFAVGNQVSAPLTVAAGIVAILGGAAALAAPSAPAGWVLVALTSLGTAAFALLGGVLGDRAAARVPAPAPSGCTGVCTGCSLVDGCGGEPATVSDDSSAGERGSADT